MFKVTGLPVPNHPLRHLKARRESVRNLQIQLNAISSTKKQQASIRRVTPAQRLLMSSVWKICSLVQTQRVTAPPTIIYAQHITNASSNIATANKHRD